MVTHLLSVTNVAFVFFVWTLILTFSLREKEPLVAAHFLPRDKGLIC